MRVLYFTVVPLAAADNGGNVACRNHVRRLSQDPGIELVVLAGVEPADQVATADFLQEWTTEYRVIPFIDGHVRQSGPGPRAFARFLTTMAYNFPLEMRALNQQHLAGAVAQAVTDFDVHCLVIDYTLSALFLDWSQLQRIPKVLIKLNREAEFYESQVASGEIDRGAVTARLSAIRLRRFELDVERRMAKLIVIGPRDAPLQRPANEVAVITPYLDAPSVRWNGRGSGVALFVGSVTHTPNRLAAEWIVFELAPALLRLAPQHRIVLVGATAADLRAPCGENVVLLGRSDERTLAQLLQGGADVSLCPVANDFGVKFKALEALANGIPLLPSAATLVGLPQLPADPHLSMTDSARDAGLLADLLSGPSRLDDLSRRQAQAQQAFEATQADVWSRELSPILR